MFTKIIFSLMMAGALVSCISMKTEKLYDEQELLSALYSPNYDTQKQAITKLLNVGRNHRPLTRKETGWLTDLIDKKTDYRLKIRAIPTLCYAKDMDAVIRYLTKYIEKSLPINNEAIIINGYICRSLSLLGDKRSIVVISDWLDKLKKLPPDTVDSMTVDDSAAIVLNWLNKLKNAQKIESNPKGTTEAKTEAKKD